MSAGTGMRHMLGCIHKLALPLCDPLRMSRVVPEYLAYLADLVRYSRSDGAERIHLVDLYPCLGEKTSSHPIDSYFYMTIWAARRILQSGAGRHVDVASRIDFVGLLSLFTKVTYIDLRPLMLNIARLECKQGNILSLPYPSDSVPSLSCLSVAEHIGLGRYGDPLDPHGTRKACAELARVLAKGAYLYFAVPVGTPRVRFNAHRVHSPRQILEYFQDLTLVEFSGTDHHGNFLEDVDPKELGRMGDGTGFFRFTRL